MCALTNNVCFPVQKIAIKQGTKVFTILWEHFGHVLGLTVFSVCETIKLITHAADYCY